MQKTKKAKIREESQKENVPSLSLSSPLTQKNSERERERINGFDISKRDEEQQH